MLDVATTIDELEPVGLAELEERAALQTRTDRKYVIGPDELERLLGAIERDDPGGDGCRVLEIEGRRRFGYRSVYFDTPDFASYLGAAHRRPQRFKVRTRCYLDTDSCWIEVKLRTGRRQTAKHRRSHDPGRPTALTPEAIELVTSFPRLRALAFDLAPVLRTEYRRSTLLAGDQRATIDTDVRCAALAGGASPRPTADLGGHLVVETKSAGQPGAVDRALWSIGRRPVTISKFAIGMATAHPELPANKWHRTIDRYVHADPTA